MRLAAFCVISEVKLEITAGLMFAFAVALAATGPRFEVASIRPSAPGTRGILYHLPGDRFRVQGFTLLNLISYAWDLPDAQIDGLPNWARSDHFDIEAVPEAAPSEPSKELESPRKKEMVRNLITERFRLAAHTEQRDSPTYSLVVGKGGPKITRNSGAEYHIYRIRNGVDFQKVSMQVVAKYLSGTLRPNIGRAVFDKTGFDGEYDFKLIFAGLRAGTDSDLPSVFSAIEELGLKLQPDHAPLTFLVVEHADKPSAN